MGSRGEFGPAAWMVVGYGFSFGVRSEQHEDGEAGLVRLPWQGHARLWILSRGLDGVQHRPLEGGVTQAVIVLVPAASNAPAKPRISAPDRHCGGPVRRSPGRRARWASQASDVVGEQRAVGFASAGSNKPISTSTSCNWLVHSSAIGSCQFTMKPAVTPAVRAPAGLRVEAGGGELDHGQFGQADRWPMRVFASCSHVVACTRSRCTIEARSRSSGPGRG
jgi:hypothetical protein